MNKQLPQEGWPNFGLVHTRKWRGWWKIGTYVVCAVSSYALVFHVEFEQKKHVFSGLRRWHKSMVDGLFGINSKNADGQTGTTTTTTEDKT